METLKYKPSRSIEIQDHIVEAVAFLGFNLFSRGKFNFREAFGRAFDSRGRQQTQLESKVPEKDLLSLAEKESLSEVKKKLDVEVYLQTHQSNL